MNTERLFLEDPYLREFDVQVTASLEGWLQLSRTAFHPGPGGQPVELEGFDAQACGGAHVHSTGEIGEARIVKFDNRGKNNKCFYWELDPSSA